MTFASDIQKRKMEISDAELVKQWSHLRFGTMSYTEQTNRIIDRYVENKDFTALEEFRNHLRICSEYYERASEILLREYERTSDFSKIAEFQRTIPSRSMNYVHATNLLIAHYAGGDVSALENLKAELPLGTDSHERATRLLLDEYVRTSNFSKIKCLQYKTPFSSPSFSRATRLIVDRYVSTSDYVQLKQLITLLPIHHPTFAYAKSMLEPPSYVSALTHVSQPDMDSPPPYQD